MCGGNEKRKRCEDRTPWNTDVYGSAKEKAVVHSLWDAPQDCLLLLVPVCATRAEVMVRHIIKDTMAFILATHAHSSWITCSGGSHLSCHEQHYAEVHVVKS